MVKPEKCDHFHLVFHFMVPLKKAPHMQLPHAKTMFYGYGVQF